jgi:hypothetical protein
MLVIFQYAFIFPWWLVKSPRKIHDWLDKLLFLT